MKNKGFTLIELLAVIVILSIIVIITVPMIMNVIDKAKLGALEDSAYGLIESANLYYAKNMDHIESYTLFEIQEGKQTSESKLEFKGKIDGNAKIVLTKEGKVALCLTSGKTYAKKEIEESKVTTASVSSDTTCTIPNLADNDFNISIEGSSSNYYDKDTIDIKINDLQTKIDANKTNINMLTKTISEKTVSSNVNKTFLSAAGTKHIWSFTSQKADTIINLDAHSTFQTTSSTVIGYGISAKINNQIVEGLIYSDSYKAGAGTPSMSLHGDIFLPLAGDYIILYAVSTADVDILNTLIYSNVTGVFY